MKNQKPKCANTVCTDQEIPISNSLCKKGHFENQHEIKYAIWAKQYFV